MRPLPPPPTRAIHTTLTLRSTINISRVQLAEDFLVVDAKYPPSTWTSAIYASDVPRSWTWRSEELRPLHNMHIIEQLRGLRQLATVVANHSVFLSTAMVRELVERAHASLRFVDFERSGMEREKPWAIKGGREEVVAVVRRMEEEGGRRPY